MVIITAGMIGVGKTTLTGLIADHLDTQAFFEPVEKIPYSHFFTQTPNNMHSFYKFIF